MYSAMTNSLVFQHLEKVTPNLASEFKQKHKSYNRNSNLTLESVVEKFFVDSSVYNHMLKVTPHLANEFLRKNPLVCQNLVSIQTLALECNNQRRRKATSNHIDAPCKKIKTTSELTQNSVVYHHLLDVAPDLANEFKQKHSVMFPIETSLKELVDQYVKDNGHIQEHEKESQASEGIIPNSSPDSIQVITLSDEEVIDVSSSSESSSEEDTDSDVIPICEIRDNNNDDESSFLKVLEEQFECFVSTSSSSNDSDPEAEKDKSKVSNYNSIANSCASKPIASPAKMYHDNSKIQPSVSNHNENNPENVDLDERLNEYCHISESSIYTGLTKSLEKDSIVDKIVLHILNKDILISQLNFDHIILCGTQILRHKHSSIPASVKLGSFSPQDNNIITSNWKKLVTEMNIDNPEETFMMFCKRPTKETKLKANVLGLYLSQGLRKLRLAADVFFHSERKILNFAKGNISTSEHNFIMDYISKRGETPEAFSSCNKLLSRRYPDVIRQHYFKHFENLLKKGPYTMLENKICISEVMEKSNIKTVLDIKNVYSREGTVRKDTFKEIAKKLGRPVPNIVSHWEHWLKPLLLQYHAGTINFDVRKILVNYLLEKNLVYMQDIPWDELLMNQQFAGHNKSSLGHLFNDLVRFTQRKHGCKREEVSIEQIAAYVDKLNPKVGKQLSCHKQELIDYYRSFIDVKKV